MRALALLLLLVTTTLGAAPRRDAAVETLARPVAVRSGFERVSVKGAGSLRLHVSGAVPGTVLWLAGERDGALQRFEVTASEQWLPTVDGSVVHVSAEAQVTIDKVAVAEAQADGATACLQDAACGAFPELPELAEASRAVAMIRFVRGDASYVCTGALVQDAAKSGTPYFLTAQHCISTQEEAASIEAVWDSRAESCGAVPSRGVRTYGADLIVASATTDVALLRLRKIPADRVFLRVETAPLTAGTATYRLSHADGAPQTFSSGVVRNDGAMCPFAPREQFIYTSPTAGTVSTGSSGAPLLLPGLRVAGQLLGKCGSAANDPCAITNDTVDGALAASWTLLAPYLDAPAPTPMPRRRAARH